MYWQILPRYIIPNTFFDFCIYFDTHCFVHCVQLANIYVSRVISLFIIGDVIIELLLLFHFFHYVKCIINVKTVLWPPIGRTSTYIHRKEKIWHTTKKKRALNVVVIAKAHTIKLYSSFNSLDYVVFFHIEIARSVFFFCLIRIEFTLFWHFLCGPHRE